MTAQGLHIHNFVFHSSGKSQIHTGSFVLELGPENTGGVQQVQALVYIDPLLPPGDAGAVAGFGGLLLCHLVNEGGFAYVGHPHHHGADRAAHLSFLPPLGNLVLENVLNDGRKLLYPPAGAGVGLQNGVSLCLKISGPGFVLRRVGLVCPVEDDQAGLWAADGIDVWVAAGGRNTCVNNLYHNVYQFQVGLNLPPGLGHVAGIPLDIHRDLLKCQRFARKMSVFCKNDLLYSLHLD